MKLRDGVDRKLGRWLRKSAAGVVTVGLLLQACRSTEADASDRPSAVATVSAVGMSCAATATSLTPASRSSAPDPEHGARVPTPGFRTVADVPLSGPASRFDYQSFDPASGRLWIAHMNAGRVVLFDVDSGRVVGEIPDLPRVTGVWAVPSRHQVYASAAGAHEVAVIDDRTLRVVARVAGARFPDGIAFVPGAGTDAGKVFVSDESGEADVVIDAGTLARRSTIALGGEAGNTHYDSVSRCILVAVQTRGQLVAIDPASERVVARYDVPGVEAPHGFTLDETRRLAFVTGEGNAALAVLDLRTMRVTQRLKVGDDPDVLAWDPGWRRLYVASESGGLSSFWATGDTLLPLGDERIPHAHTVAVDPRTHRVYAPLENVGGRPVLRVLAPAPPAADAPN
jgi:DNA-binding beta-propeller fold protein YncE